MKPIRTFRVVPKLPAPILRLMDLAYNLRWAWDHDTIELFRHLEADLWEACGHNPVLMLGSIEQQRLEEMAQDEGFLAHLERCSRDLDGYLQAGRSWFQRTYKSTDRPLVAYFSAEFGLTECLSIFAGGLGVLAGDHLKSSSDLAVPLVGVGLMYQQGYFRQYIDAAGRQQEDYVDNEFANLPLTLVRRPDGTPVTVDVLYATNRVFAQIWSVSIGRTELFLLDTNIPANVRSEDRDITDQLYGGDVDMRMRQEILLGIGGLRALEALEIEPTVYHMNEGHSAFLALELVRRLMGQHGLGFAEARLLASSSLVFTTHTPVEAGHDYFSPNMLGRYFGEYHGSLGLSKKDFLGLGRRNPNDDAEAFCMTILALRMAGVSQGVSRLHGEISRRMWQSLWPGVPEQEIPIGHVTNGVHLRSWISNEMNQLYDRYLGPGWREEPAGHVVWRRAGSIPTEELWRTHERRRERLVAFARRRLHAQLVHRGVAQREIEAAEEVLDPDALTIGFARRFATYKRATLFLKDPGRLARILNDPQRPVQIIFAGKAHPRDEAGKELIREIAGLIRQPEFRRRMVLIEDYDMAVARYLVQGADVWLNTPLRPNEASGTSGMKAVANGVLNLSTLDGWWDEAWLGQDPACPVGWAIGRGEVYEDREYQDRVEAEALYDLLESDVVPTFYERRADGIPARWVARMKVSIGSLARYFNAQRMVKEYAERLYLPAHENYRLLLADDARRVRNLATWMDKVRQAWPRVRIEAVDAEMPSAISVGETITVRARVSSGGLSAADLAVEVYVGRLNADGDIIEATATPMGAVETEGGLLVYETSAAPCCKSGRHGYTARVLPAHSDLRNSFLPGLIAWA